MKQNKITTANAVALTTILVWLVCSLAFVYFPTLSQRVAQSWFHGMSITKLTRLTLPDAVLGGISATVVSWLIAYTYGLVSEALHKK